MQMINIIEKLKYQQTRKSTAKMYLNVWRQFNAFLMRLDVKPKFWEQRVSIFMAYLVEFKKLQSSTIKSYISAIKKTLIADNYKWDDSYMILSTLTKACRVVNDCVTTRLPIRFGFFEMILYEVQKIFAQQPYLETLYKALFALGYYGLMRIGELTASDYTAKAKDIHIGTNKDKILIILHSSKTHSRESRPQKIKIQSLQSEGLHFKGNNI